MANDLDTSSWLQSWHRVSQEERNRKLCILLHTDTHGSSNTHSSHHYRRVVHVWLDEDHEYSSVYFPWNSRGSCGTLWVICYWVHDEQNQTHADARAHITLDRFKDKENNTMYISKLPVDKKGSWKPKRGNLIIEINASDAHAVLEFLIKRAAFFPFAFIFPTLKRWPRSILSVCLWLLMVGSVCVSAEVG